MFTTRFFCVLFAATLPGAHRYSLVLLIIVEDNEKRDFSAGVRQILERDARWRNLAALQQPDRKLPAEGKLPDLCQERHPTTPLADFASNSGQVRVVIGRIRACGCPASRQRRPWAHSVRRCAYLSARVSGCNFLRHSFLLIDSPPLSGVASLYTYVPTLYFSLMRFDVLVLHVLGSAWIDQAVSDRTQVIGQDPG